MSIRPISPAPEKITVQSVDAVTNARNFETDPAPDEQPKQPHEQCDPVEVSFVGNDCMILKPNVLKTKLLRIGTLQ
jgi:hypothetical protein